MTNAPNSSNEIMTPPHREHHRSGVLLTKSQRLGGAYHLHASLRTIRTYLLACATFPHVSARRMQPLSPYFECSAGAMHRYPDWREVAICCRTNVYPLDLHTACAVLEIGRFTPTYWLPDQ